MRKNQSGFAHLILVIVIVLAGIGALGYFAFKNGQIKTAPSAEGDLTNAGTQPNTSTSTITLTPIPTSVSTANWKTYMSASKDFSFKYLEDLVVETSDVADLENKPENRGKDIITIVHVKPGPRGTDYQENIIQIRRIKKEDLVEVYPKGPGYENVTMNGINFTKYAADPYWIVFRALDQGLDVEITVSNRDSDRAIASQIFSTFKYTK